MKHLRAFVTTLLMLSGALAHAETEAEYASQPPAAAATPAQQPVARRTAFAAASAKTASRLPLQEREDRAFIRAAAAGSRFEAEAARVALAKSTDARVRALATDLIVQHNATRLEFQQLLHVRAMALPMMENEHRRVLKRLGKLGGRKLDREFLAQVGLKHQRVDLAQYERAGARTGDPSLKAWVERQLPTLRQQVAMAERMAAPEVRQARDRGAAVTQPGQVSPVMRASLATRRMGASAAGVSASGSR